MIKDRNVTGRVAGSDSGAFVYLGDKADAIVILIEVG